MKVKDNKKKSKDTVAGKTPVNRPLDDKTEDYRWLNIFDSTDIIIFFIATLSFLVFFQVRHFDFVNFDDSKYLTENTFVQKGLSFAAIKWAFSTSSSDYWQPLTWITHLLDCTIYGMSPGGHHITSLILHVLNTVLVFFVFEKITGMRNKAAIIAALFAVHPAHVESVAWVSERKDVLYAFFWFLSLLSYHYYVTSPSVKRYLIVLFFFSCSLMSKPMAITFPLIVILLDVWPFGRLNKGNVVRLILEKIPLFFFSAASSIYTFYAQKAVGTLAPVDMVSIGARFKNAFISYLSYIYIAFVPINLAAIYPFSFNLSTTKAVLSLALMLIVSAFAVFTLFGYKSFKPKPYVFTGWFWFVITLLPVIGLVQVGPQAMADRYTYIPYIGIFIILVMMWPDNFFENKIKKYAMYSLTMTVILVLSLLSYRQTGYWKNTITLFDHAVLVTKDNFIAHNSLGASLAQAGRFDESLPHLREAIILNPIFFEAYINLGNVLFTLKKTQDAANIYKKAIELNPKSAMAYNGYGVAVLNSDDNDNSFKEALEAFKQALIIDPNFMPARMNLEIAIKEQGPRH
ncbi:tetratricopeptide repeat protein [Candidatus Magnetomonas plexicatena]|uniref:tetratricopeptide repeat protein n=1 Tax=Candidatus Magnetomonas plexicatena TaxID=2552947 RepID=UPI001C76A565|nr:tetratricopeptide repeat protein [Nitrospirales bacterium LBB_01]